MRGMRYSLCCRCHALPVASASDVAFEISKAPATTAIIRIVFSGRPPLISTEARGVQSLAQGSDFVNLGVLGG